MAESGNGGAGEKSSRNFARQPCGVAPVAARRLRMKCSRKTTEPPANSTNSTTVVTIELLSLAWLMMVEQEEVDDAEAREREETPPTLRDAIAEVSSPARTRGARVR